MEELTLSYPALLPYQKTGGEKAPENVGLDVEEFGRLEEIEICGWNPGAILEDHLSLAYGESGRLVYLISS